MKKWILMLISAIMVVGCGMTVCGADPLPIELDTDTAAVIENAGDIAYFSFVPAETTYYCFYSMGESDTYGFLYDEEMNEIANDDDNGDGNNFRFIYLLNAGEQYYFGAKFYSDEAGSFEVRLEVTSPDTSGQCEIMYSGVIMKVY